MDELDNTFVSVKDVLQALLYATKTSGMIMVEVNSGILKLIHKSNTLGAPIIGGDVASTDDVLDDPSAYDKFARAVQKIIDVDALHAAGFCSGLFNDKSELIAKHHREAIAAGEFLPKRQKLLLTLGRIRKMATKKTAVQFDNGLECIGLVSYRDFVDSAREPLLPDSPRLSRPAQRFSQLLFENKKVTELSMACTSPKTKTLRSGAHVAVFQLFYVLLDAFKRKCTAVYISLPEEGNDFLLKVLNQLGFHDITDDVENAFVGYTCMVLLPYSNTEDLSGDYRLLNSIKRTILEQLPVQLTRGQVPLTRVCPLRTTNGVKKCV
jgi:hypothetical protein